MEHQVDNSSFPARVLRPSLLASVDRGGGARTTPLVTEATGATSFLNGITRFEPGATIRHHTHNCVESVLVIEGDAVLDIDGHEVALSQFDATFVPANVPHHFRNPSTAARMAIFWTYASVDATRTIGGATTRIDAEQRGHPEQPGAVTQVVSFVVKPDLTGQFETAVAEAAAFFQRAPGCRTFELRRSVEQPARYRLLIGWTALEDQTLGSRRGDGPDAWQALISPYLAEPPVVEHVKHVLKGF